MPASIPRRFATVDVFTRTPFSGNPLAVVLDAKGLSTAQMQAIAREFNYVETSFILPSLIGCVGWSLQRECVHAGRSRFLGCFQKLGVDYEVGPVGRSYDLCNRSRLMIRNDTREIST